MMMMMMMMMMMIWWWWWCRSGSGGRAKTKEKGVEIKRRRTGQENKTQT